MFYVYIVECNDKTFYIGSTNDLLRRIHRHNTSKSGAHYTKIRRPVTLRYFEEHLSYGIARKREAELKKLSRKQKEAFLMEKSLTHLT